MEVNDMTIHMPYQLFIDGEFVDAHHGKMFDTINPNDGSVRNYTVFHSVNTIIIVRADFV